MGKHAQLIMGPAGSGKSTYCDVIRTHCENLKRTVHCINLDPAADDIKYPVSIDIKEVITVDEVMEDLSFGPNGGLIYAIEFFMQNAEWFKEQLGDYEDDYLLIDCPGQIELYSHMDTMRHFVDLLQDMGYRVCGVYLLDSQFLVDSAKFIAGSLMCLSAMLRLELPHINVLTKMDLMGNKAKDDDYMEKFIHPDMPALIHDLQKNTNKKFHKLNEAIGTLVEEHNLVSFIPLDITNEDSISYVLSHADNAIQYGEDLDAKPPRDMDADEDDNNNEDGEFGSMDD